MKKIPIGIQAFSSLIEGGFVYLDKIKNFCEEVGSQLEDYEAEYAIQTKGSLSNRFKRLVTTIAKQTDN